MNKQPVYYMQTDSRWKNKPYKVTGENTTIGDSGCGPTCAAMLIETLTGKTFTPLDACNWAMKKGYKALNQGTYYSYFVPQFKEHGIACERLNTANLYGNGKSTVHDKAFKMLKEGYYIIACMGKGTWTSSGHYVVVWWEDGTVRINDPYSKLTKRIKGNINTFRSQVKYYWAVDGRAYNTQNGGENGGKSEEKKPAAKVKVDPAKSFSKAYSKEYSTTANLNLRSGAGTSKKSLAVMPKGAKVRCYGYYTKVGTTPWLYVQYGDLTGFCSKSYLK